MEISVETETGKVRQHGGGLGELSGCHIEYLTDEEGPVLLTLMGQVTGDGYVRFATADRTIQRVAASAEWQARQDAQQAASQAEDEQLRALVAAHDDPLVKLLAKRLGVG